MTKDLTAEIADAPRAGTSVAARVPTERAVARANRLVTATEY